MTIEIELTKASYEFLVLLLTDRHSLSDKNKAEVLNELQRRNRSGGADVKQPH